MSKLIDDPSEPEPEPEALERLRLSRLHDLRVLDTGTEPLFDALTLKLHPATPMAAEGIEEIRTRDLDPNQLFRSFFQEVQGRPMDEEETALFLEVSRRILEGEVQP